MFSLPYLWGMMIFPLSIYLKTNFQVLCTWYIKMTKALFLPSKSLQPTGVRHKNKGVHKFGEVGSQGVTKVEQAEFIRPM